MARTKKMDTTAQAEDMAQTMTTEDVAQDTTAGEQTFELQRANRVAVSADVNNDGFAADFYRTHRKLTSISSFETGWVAKAGMNKSAQREDFRAFITEHAADIGIDWKPEDMRTDNNKRIAKYTTDADLSTDAIALIGDDITAFVVKCPYEISVQDITVDDIVPTTKSAKGTDLSTLGIENGRYAKNGNWAWATVGICVTLKANEQEIYVSLNCQLVSGQLKKPSHIGDLGYTQTAWNTLIKQELIQAGILKVEEESK